MKDRDTRQGGQSPRIMGRDHREERRRKTRAEGGRRQRGRETAISWKEHVQEG